MTTKFVFPSMNDNFLAGIRNDSYQYETRKAVLETLDKIGCKFRHCVDGGAHVGTWSVDLVKRFQWVHAFEPIIEVANCFKKNILEKNYTLYNLALSSKKEKLKFKYDFNQSGASQPSILGNVTCLACPLDELKLQDIDYIKLDCQGMEEQIINGAKELIVSQKPILHLEMKNSSLKEFNTDKKTLTKKIIKLGYQQVRKIVNEVIFKPI